MGAGQVSRGPGDRARASRAARPAGPECRRGRIGGPRPEVVLCRDGPCDASGVRRPRRWTNRSAGVECASENPRDRILHTRNPIETIPCLLGMRPGTTRSVDSARVTPETGNGTGLQPRFRPRAIHRRMALRPGTGFGTQVAVLESADAGGTSARASLFDLEYDRVTVPAPPVGPVTRVVRSTSPPWRRPPPVSACGGRPAISACPLSHRGRGVQRRPQSRSLSRHRTRQTVPAPPHPPESPPRST